MNREVHRALEGFETGMIEDSGTSQIMLNKLILAKIAESMSPENLLTLRRTCTTWNDCFVPVIRKKHRPVLLQNEIDGENSIRKFTGLISQSQLLPYTKYHLQGPTPCHLYFMTLLSICGDSIESLDLEWENFPNTRLDANEVRSILLNMVPKLTELKLSINNTPGPHLPEEQTRQHLGEIIKLKRIHYEELSYTHVEVIDGIGELLDDLLHPASSVESLSLKPYYRSAGLSLRLLCTIRDQAGSIHKLKTLVIRNLKADQLQVLTELGHRNLNPLRLELFDVSLFASSDYSKTTDDLLHSFLTTQSTTLRQLKIEIRCERSPLNNRDSQHNIIRTVRVPHLATLQTFQLNREESNWSWFVMQYDRETLAGNLSRLRRFIYRIRTTNRSVLFDSNYQADVNNFGVSAATDLALDVNEAGGGLKMWNAFRPKFPNVTSLEFMLWDSQPQDYGPAWSSFTALTSLRIRYQPEYNGTNSLNLDTFLSGVPKSKFKAITHALEAETTEGVCGRPSLETIRLLLDKFKNTSGISDAKRLQEFIVDVQEHSYTVSDIGGYFGLAVASPTLQRVIVKRHGARNPNQKNSISSKCEELIRVALSQFVVLSL